MTSDNLDDSLKLIAKSSVVIFIGLFLSKLFMYLYRVVIARHFGPEVYGLYSLAVIIVSWFVIFSVFGLNSGILRYIPFYRGKRETNKIRYLFKSVFTFLLFTSIVFGIILFFLSNFISVDVLHNSNLINFLKIFSLAVPLIILSQLFLFLILAFEKINWYSFIFNILQDFVKVFSLVILIFFGFGIKSIYFSYLLGIFSALLVVYLVSRFTLKSVFKKHNLNKKEKSKVFREIFSYSWPLLFSGIASIILIWTDSFLIGYFLDAKNVGFYNSAIPIAMLLIIFSELFTKLFSPFITKEYSKDKKNIGSIKQLSKQVGKWIFLLNLPILLLILIFPSQIIQILFGSQYIVAENSLRFLSIGMFFSALFTISQRLIVMIGKSKTILVDTIIISIINISLNIFLIPRYGISGAAFATMISVLLLNLLFMIQANNYLSIIPLRRKMKKIFLISLIPTVILILLKIKLNSIHFLGVFLMGSFFILLYFLLILLTNCLDKNDLMILKSIKSKIVNK
jgi:O-antigen/teichoic acid export membrane protein